MLSELCRLMAALGSFMKMAFSDVTDKAATISNNNKFFQQELKKEPMSLQNFILEEIKEGVIQCNGDNNKKVLKSKEEKNGWQGKYTSTGRILVRNCWFSNFMCSLFTSLMDSPELEMVAAVSKAYEDHLAPNHGFAVKLGARAGFKFAGTRAQAYP